MPGSTMKGAKGSVAALPPPTKKENKSVSKKAEETNLKKRKSAAKEVKPKRQPVKAVKDPNMPKKPATAFFVFLEEFRKTFMAENPAVKAVSVVGKAGGEKWKSLTEAEKAPYVAKAGKRKTDYEKSMQAYNQKKDVAEAEKPKVETHKEEEEDDDDDYEEDDENEDDDE